MGLLLSGTSQNSDKLFMVDGSGHGAFYDLPEGCGPGRIKLALMSKPRTNSYHLTSAFVLQEVGKPVLWPVLSTRAEPSLCVLGYQFHPVSILNLVLTNAVQNGRAERELGHFVFACLLSSLGSAVQPLPLLAMRSYHVCAGMGRGVRSMPLVECMLNGTAQHAHAPSLDASPCACNTTRHMHAGRQRRGSHGGGHADCSLPHGRAAL